MRTTPRVVPHFCLLQHLCGIRYIINAKELKKWLASQGCTFETKKGGSGHLIVRRGDRKSELPMHGGGKELGTGLVNAIKKQLELK